MSEEHPTPRPSVAGRFFGDVFHMPGWQKSLLGIAFLAGVAGFVGQMYGKFTAAPPPEGSRSIVGKAPQSPTTAEPVAGEPAPEPTVFQRISPNMSGMGLSFVAAFVIGWAFRVFIKTMVTVTVLGAGLLLALSY